MVESTNLKGQIEADIAANKDIITCMNGGDRHDWQRWH